MANKIGVVAFAFGAPSKIRSNQIIGRIASQIASELKAVGIYTQADINIEGEIKVRQTEDAIEIHQINEEFGNPPPTLRIARGAIKWAKESGIRDIWIVAAEPHIWRALRDTQKAAREAGLIINIWATPRINQYKELDWFCLDSTQERTQSRADWEKRERVLRHTPFWIYKLIAS